jgi:D-glycero-D-manno-heptose 1,7-bisphosphate phosphatase
MTTGPIPPMGESKKVPILYLDIDGTVRLGKDELGHFVNTAEEVQVFPEVPDLLAGYKDLGWRIVGISNQGGIGLGYMDEQTCIDALAETNKQTGNMIDKIVYCPHKPDEGCDCRKPGVGMLNNVRAWLFANNDGESYPYEIGLFVGDRPEDEQCAYNAAVPFLEAAVWRTGEHLDGLVKEALG